MARPRKPLVMGIRVELDGEKVRVHLDNPGIYWSALRHYVGRNRLTIEPEEETRRQKANRYYHGVIVKMIADETGHSRDQMHEILKYKFNSELIDVTDPTTGEIEELRVPKSTAKLTVSEFNVYLEHCLVWAAEFLGMVIPEADPNYAVKRRKDMATV